MKQDHVRCRHGRSTVDIGVDVGIGIGTVLAHVVVEESVDVGEVVVVGETPGAVSCRSV